MGINADWKKKSAIVRFIGENNTPCFTVGREYEAFFLEYWQGKRDSLHVKGNDGQITDFNSFADFKVVKDEDDVLNTYEATVKCLTKRFENELFGIKYNKLYKAIAMDKNGYYLVMDDSYDCYFYPPDDFEIIEDPHGVLSCCSVYYSYYE